MLIFFFKFNKLQSLNNYLNRLPVTYIVDISSGTCLVFLFSLADQYLHLY